MRKLKDVEIQFVSFVKNGANQKKFFLTKEKDAKTNVEINVRTMIKKDDPKKLVYGVVYEPGVEDAHGDIMDAEDIEKMSHNFLAKYRNIDTSHNYIPGAGTVVESYCPLIDFEIGKEIIKKGSWVLVTKADEEIWNDVQNKVYQGYSMAGWAGKVEEIDETETKKSFFKKIGEKLGLSKNVMKDFDTELENQENNDVSRYIWILERAIDQILWNEQDGETKKDKILLSLGQLTKKVEEMTFTSKSNQNSETKTNPIQPKTKNRTQKTDLRNQEGDIMLKKEIMETLEKDEALRAEVLAKYRDGLEQPEESQQSQQTPTETSGEESSTETPSQTSDEGSTEDTQSTNDSQTTETQKSKDSGNPIGILTGTVTSLIKQVSEMEKSMKEVTDMLMTPSSGAVLNKDSQNQPVKYSIRAKSL